VRQDEREVVLQPDLGGTGETLITPSSHGLIARVGARAPARLLRILLIGLLLPIAAVSAARDVHALAAEDRAAVAQAFRAAERGEWDLVWRLLEPVADPLPAKTLRWLRMVEDRQPADFATMAAFLMANPHWPAPDRLQAIAEDTISDPADHALIRRFFADREPLTTRGQIRYAEALFDAGDSDRAIELIRLAWVNGEFSAREDKRFNQKYRRHLREEDHIARLDRLLWEQRLTSAGAMLERVPTGYRRLAEARMRLQRRQGGVDRAIEAVPASLQGDPGLVFDRLSWRRKGGFYDGVTEILLDPPSVLGNPSRWWFEREVEIRRLLRQRDFDLAYRLASRHGQTEGLDFAEAEWLAGWLALRYADQPGEAFRRFTRMYEAVSAPQSQSRAAYWAGRSAAALGDRALAHYWYQAAARHHVAFYGQLAAIELGQPPPPADPPMPTPSERAAFEASEITQVVRMLIEVGATEQLRPFAMHLATAARSPTDVGMAADLLASSGRADLVTQAGRLAAYLGQVNEAASFPIPEIDGLLASPPGHPEPALLLGVARQESTFNTLGVSHAGARGMMQLMPRTAQLMARALNLPYNNARLTADPAYNIRLGRHYLRTLLKRYDAEVVLAVAAYNGGPSRVNEWLRTNGDPRRADPHELIDWIELIPLGETRNYVQRVLEARNLYRERLAERKVATIPFLGANGPLEPMPRPRLKPLSDARQARLASVVADGPRPELKPSVVAPNLARASGQGAAVALRMPEARPLPASFEVGGTELAEVVAWPELKPVGRLDHQAAGQPLPQPELKPGVP
jgi:soluble lytic murein transglycosylase